MRDWLSHRVAAAPDATALVRAEDGEAWTYADLDRLVEETAGRLAAHGVDAGTHLGVHLSPRVGYVGLVHAAMRLGATLVPVGHRLTPREIGVRLDRADVDVLVCGADTERTAIEGAAGSGIPILSVDEPTDSDDSHGSDAPTDIEDSDVAALHDSDPEPIPDSTWNLEERLCVLFTSGTSGRPKAVEITAGNVLFSAVASAFRLGVHPDDRWLVTLPLHHAGGLSPVYRSVLAGTAIVLREDFEPGEAADDVDRYDVTGVSLVPTMLTRMLDRRGTLSDSLRTVLLGGAPASERLIERCENYSVPVYPTYGMTETASQIATATPAEAFKDPDTVGRPIFLTDLTVVDDAGDPVDRGETGELVVSGPTVSPGYYGDPEATAAATDDHGLHTGDVGRIDENGRVHVVNRLDDRIVTGGENVDPGEVADVLADHDAVHEAAVLGLPDETWGERVGALIVPAEQTDASEESSADDGDEGADGDGDNDESVAAEVADAEAADPGADANGSTVDATDVGNETAETNGAIDDEVADVAQPDAAEADAAEADAIPEAAESNVTREAAAETDGERDPPIDERALLEYARERLSGFKMPRTVAYVEELPRTVSGTVDREAARDRLIEEGVEPSVPSVEFDRAGFEPADPEPADREESGAADREGSESNDGEERGDGSEAAIEDGTENGTNGIGTGAGVDEPTDGTDDDR
ncbi:AMP-binding protein [haloarchaeon 3A1-DGR]|nr:AMP-binding protein [haloarchaeon 3A1-DGR]